jgi:ABC-type bacteriocin/lantibiotic exporter with double-glycine peptidase domain
MKITKIPFVKNSKDNTHCMQASIAMVLGYFNIKTSFKKIDTYTKFKKGGYSYFASSINYLLSQGLGVTLIEHFNYRKFAKEGVKYMEASIDTGVFADYKKYIDLDFEQEKMAENLINKNFKFIKRFATLTDIEGFISKGYLVITSINPRKLDGRKGYASHAVVIVGIDKKAVTIHDPGIPAMKNWTVSRKLFLKAFTDGDRRTTNLIAVTPTK